MFLRLNFRTLLSVFGDFTEQERQFANLKETIGSVDNFVTQYPFEKQSLSHTICDSCRAVWKRSEYDLKNQPSTLVVPLHRYG